VNPVKPPDPLFVAIAPLRTIDIPGSYHARP